MQKKGEDYIKKDIVLIEQKEVHRVGMLINYCGKLNII